jgi:hypothetical protein
VIRDLATRHALKVNLIITERLAIKVMNRQTVAASFSHMSSKLCTLASSGKVQNQHPGEQSIRCRFLGSTAHQLTFFLGLFSCFSTRRRARFVKTQKTFRDVGQEHGFFDASRQKNWSKP